MNFMAEGFHRDVVDESARKKALRMVPYALYLLGTRRATVRSSDDLHAYVVSWVAQASFAPPMLTVAMGKDSRGLELVKESRVFTLNFLGADQKALAKKFFKDVERTDGHFSGHPYALGKRTGCPVFPELPATIECDVETIVEGANDHAIVLARIVDAEHRRDAAPLTHAATGWQYAG
jgi:flavin reductase (DIM6/NTAB) family NADH-FMN oxidoreductase RutF